MSTVYFQLSVAFLVISTAQAMEWNPVQKALKENEHVIKESGESFKVAQEQLQISKGAIRTLVDLEMFANESISPVEKAAAQIIDKENITDDDIMRLNKRNERRPGPERNLTQEKYARLLERYDKTQINLLKAKQQVQILQGQLGDVVEKGGNYQKVIDEMQKQSEPMSKWISSLQKYLTGSLITTCIAVLAFLTRLPMMRLDKEIKKLDILLKHKELEEG